MIFSLASAFMQLPYCYQQLGDKRFIVSVITELEGRTVVCAVLVLISALHVVMPAIDKTSANSDT